MAVHVKIVENKSLRVEGIAMKKKSIQLFLRNSDIDGDSYIFI